MEMKKTEVVMNKPIYLGKQYQCSKTLMYEFQYDCIKPKFGDKARLCYMDTDSFIMHIKTEDFYKDIADDVERWFDTSNYDELRNESQSLRNESPELINELKELRNKSQGLRNKS